MLFDFRQRIGSRGVDLLPIVAGDDRDLDGRLFDFLNPIYAATVSSASTGPLECSSRMSGVPMGSVFAAVSYTHLTLPTNREG